MAVRIGGGLKVVTLEGTPHNKASGTLNPSGTGRGGAQVVSGDGSSTLLELLQGSGVLAELSGLTLAGNPEEAGLAFVPQAGTNVEIYIGVRVECTEAQE